MKKLIASIIATFLLQIAIAQTPTEKYDKIILKDRTEVDCKVIEVTKEKVTFKVSSEDGSFEFKELEVSQISKINYADGKVVNYSLKVESLAIKEQKPVSLNPNQQKGTTVEPIEQTSAPTPVDKFHDVAAKAQEIPLKKPQNKGFFVSASGGYSRITDSILGDSGGGAYLGLGVGYSFSNSISLDFFINGSAFDKESSSAFFEKGSFVGIMPRLIVKVPKSNGKPLLYFTGGGGIVNTSGKVNGPKDTITWSSSDIGTGYGFQIGAGFGTPFGKLGLSYTGSDFDVRALNFSIDILK